MEPWNNSPVDWDDYILGSDESQQRIDDIILAAFGA